jgi:hypothetical protein
VLWFQWLSKISHGRDPLKCAVATAVLAAVLFGVPWLRQWCSQTDDLSEAERTYKLRAARLREEDADPSPSDANYNHDKES